MSAVLIQYMVLQKEEDIKFSHASGLLYNTPTVEWLKRMPDKAQSHTSGSLLWGLASTQRSPQAGPITLASIAGVENSMANISRVSGTLFLSHFSNTFPLSQKKYWKHVHFISDMTSVVNFMLYGTRLPLQQWLTGYKPKNGTNGWNSACTRNGIITWRTAPPPYNSTSSSVLLHTTGGYNAVGSAKLALKHQKPRSIT